MGPKSTPFFMQYFSSLARMCLPQVYLRRVAMWGRICGESTVCVTLAQDRLRGLHGNLLLDTMRCLQVHTPRKQHLSPARPEHLNTRATRTQQMRSAAPVLSAEAGCKGSADRTTTDHFQDSVWSLSIPRHDHTIHHGMAAPEGASRPHGSPEQQGLLSGDHEPCAHHLTLLSHSQRITESY